MLKNCKSETELIFLILYVHVAALQDVLSGSKSSLPTHAIVGMQRGAKIPGLVHN